MDIYITGTGCITPLGSNVAENHHELVASRDGLVRSSFLDSKYASLKYFGEVKVSTPDLKTSLGMDDFSGLTRTDLLAIHAFREAVAQASLTDAEISSRDTAFISASTVGGMSMTDRLYENARLISTDPEFVHSYSNAAHTLRIARMYRMKGYTDTINTSCSSSANAIMLGMELIRAGKAKRAIVGGAESLARFTVNGFNSLQILSDEKCIPFDAARDGLNLGEGAAYLVLEAEDVCRDKTHLAKIRGAGNTNDAFHASSMSDHAEGVTRCINDALADAGILPVEIDYINAHGTGTPNNDKVESMGFLNVFGDKIPPFSSTKSYTGHTLGASGAIEAVYCVLSMIHRELYPNLRTSNPAPEIAASLVTEYRKNIPVKTVISSSYGFGGNCTSLILSAV